MRAMAPQATATPSRSGLDDGGPYVSHLTEFQALAKQHFEALKAVRPPLEKSAQLAWTEAVNLALKAMGQLKNVVRERDRLKKSIGHAYKMFSRAQSEIRELNKELEQKANSAAASSANSNTYDEGQAEETEEEEDPQPQPVAAASSSKGKKRAAPAASSSEESAAPSAAPPAKVRKKLVWVWTPLQPVAAEPKVERPRLPWTNAEEVELRRMVEKHGVGKWAEMHAGLLVIDAGRRSAVDLKDKWRNITHQRP